ncbi:hypothetical protein A5893_04495 [Pedobacter psychrophilus]|uniref:DUF1569 domain-containing protein n=1 Tax=Pedobacter psychrophilus TaxID=1826909 RepID=A0A179DN28_9SPHI|nr:DUF1569 domain-containing protein [Pedobacter psychrophilus]OAQ42427.1 hypothetical protein A5893_04495 [Pedobacter psychrophilus]
MKSVFNSNDTQELVSRINSLKPNSTPLWGKMNVAQMLAHCNVSYEMAFESKHPKPNAIMRFILKAFVKSTVVGEKPYKKSSQTAPAFIITDTRDFENEKSRLIAYINKTQELGENYFDGKESLSFGVLNKTEWNNMFYKHLDHHLNQFGVLPLN